MRIVNATKIIPVQLKIRPSLKYKGVGVFALKPIKKGEIVCDMRKIDEDVFVSWLEYNKLDKATKDAVVDFCAQDGEGYYGPLDLNYLAMPLYMNHSCDGNVGSDDAGNFIAIRQIKAGEELCFDYALVISRPTYKMMCKCGSKNCRKIITGNDWMDKEFRKKNYKYMSPIQRKLADKIFRTYAKLS